MKILVVEDEEFSRRMLEGYLLQLGYEVVTASNGEEAWQELQRDEIRLVITDWVMPEMGGLELIRRIRSRDQGPYVYTILLTSKSDSQDVIQGIMDGADDYLTKPYDRDELDVRVRAGQRVIDLEESLSHTNLELREAKARLEDINAELSQANHRMKSDLEAAARIQQSLLPTTPPGNASLDCAWVFWPCDELAGDIFNVFQLDDEHLGFYLLDVAGHGVQAALLSVTLSRILSPAAGRSSVLFSQRHDGADLKTPSEIVLELNRRFQMCDEHSQFFTLFFGCLQLETLELQYVSAGHPPPVLLADGNSPRLLDARGLPVGVKEDPEYRDEILKLNPGDKLFVVSDGILEAKDSQNKMFGCDGLMDCFGNPSDSLEMTLNSIEQKVFQWCNGQPQDDVSMLAIGVRRLEGIPVQLH